MPTKHERAVMRKTLDETGIEPDLTKVPKSRETYERNLQFARNQSFEYGKRTGVEEGRMKGQQERQGLDHSTERQAVDALVKIGQSLAQTADAIAHALQSFNRNL